MACIDKQREMEEKRKDALQKKAERRDSNTAMFTCPIS